MAFLAMHDEPDLDAADKLVGAFMILAPLVQWEEGTMAPRLRPSARAPCQPEGQPREPNGDVVLSPTWS